MSVIRRNEWNAGRHRASMISLPVSRLFLHHTVTPQWIGAHAAKRLQEIAWQRGFADISYSWLVDVRGNLIEGRGWRRQGAHTRGYNSTSHAICLIGNFESSRPPTAMLRGAAQLVAEHGRYGPDRITHGHRDVGQTSCPGRYAYAQISTINRMARSGLPSPTEEPEVITDEDIEKIARRSSEMTLQRLANEDGALPIRARQEIAREVLYRVRHDQHNVGVDGEEKGLNLITRIDRVGQTVRERTSG